MISGGTFQDVDSTGTPRRIGTVRGGKPFRRASEPHFRRARHPSYQSSRPVVTVGSTGRPEHGNLEDPFKHVGQVISFNPGLEFGHRLM